MEHNEENCIFCKIIKGDIPKEFLYEDEHTVAFLDIKPVNPGHTLVIPKKHFVNIFEAPEETWLHIMRTVKKVSHAIKDGLGIENVNLEMNNGSIAGQEVFHAHMHIVPRNEHDGLKHWPGGKYTGDEETQILERIKKAL